MNLSIPEKACNNASLSGLSCVSDNHLLGRWNQKAYSYAAKRKASFVKIDAGLPTA
jgi:hypothetical protein